MALIRHPRTAPKFYPVAKSGRKFPESFKDFLSLMDLVPREEYGALARRCEELQAKMRNRKRP